MLTVYSLNPDKRLSVTIAIFFAEDVLSFWEAEFSEDMRPRKAIEAAKAWLANPCEETAAAVAAAAANATRAAANATRANATAAHAAANAAANAAAYAAYAAAYAAHAAAAHAAANAAAAAYAAYAAANATAAVYAAAANAAYAAHAAATYAANRRLYTHNKLVQLLPHLLEYKIYIKTSFKDSEQVFDLLSEKNQQRFLFNLDRLR